MLSDRRPDPDALLLTLSEPRGSSGRGRLRIYLGANAGVGKTFAMLGWAHQRLLEGMDVVAGLVETHQRKETEALLEGIPILPRRIIEHRGIPLGEFDLDGALERRPQLILVDEMAHTNAPGSRHDKRWLDIRELIESGVSVVTTLNVQHLESLNDVVEQITGIRVRETVPDSAVEAADEVVLVDVAPEELLLRLKEGKVYSGAQAQEALSRFFRPSHIHALRELALRFVAGQVGAEVEVWRHATPERAIWPIQERLLVAVGPSPTSARLVRSTRRLAHALNAPWLAVSVRVPGRTESPAVRTRLVENMNLAQSLGAEVIQTSGTNVAEEVLRISRDNNVTKIVVGKPVSGFWGGFFRPSPVDRLIRRSGDVDVYVMKGESAGPPSPVVPLSPRQDREAYGIAVGSVLVAAFLVGFLGNRLQATEAVMVFLAAITITATYASRRATFLGCILAVVAYNILIVPPRYSLWVESPRHFLTFGVLFLVGLLISTLSQRLRTRALLARAGERKAAVLARLGNRLASVRGREPILQTAMEEIANAFDSQMVLYLPQSTGRVQYVGGFPIGFPPDEKESAVAQWVFDHGRQAGRGTDTLQAATFLHVPVAAQGHKIHAVLGLYPPQTLPTLDPEQMIVLRSLVAQTALALEVEILESERQSSEARIQSEMFRNSILSSVSHELRTPIASMLGCATSLTENNTALDDRQRSELLETIREEAVRMDGLVASLLDMTRLESDHVQLRLVELPVDELIGSALAQLRQKLAGRSVETSVEPMTPFVRVDEVLAHLVLVNLLENAVKYSPPGTPLSVRAWPDRSWVCIEVADRGPGLQPEQLDLIFQKFFRGDVGQKVRGMGLGLAIAQSIVRAHQGTITASNRPGGGAAFSFTLPAVPISQSQLSELP